VSAEGSDDRPVCLGTRRVPQPHASPSASRVRKDKRPAAAVRDERTETRWHRGLPPPLSPHGRDQWEGAAPDGWDRHHRAQTRRTGSAPVRGAVPAGRRAVGSSHCHRRGWHHPVSEPVGRVRARSRGGSGCRSTGDRHRAPGRPPVREGAPGSLDTAGQGRGLRSARHQPEGPHALGARHGHDDTLAGRAGPPRLRSGCHEPRDGRAGGSSCDGAAPPDHRLRPRADIGARCRRSLPPGEPSLGHLPREDAGGDRGAIAAGVGDG